MSAKLPDSAISNLLLGRQRIVLLLVLALVGFHLWLFRFGINAARGIFFLRLLFVLVALFLVGGLFHDRLDGRHSSCAAPPGLESIFQSTHPSGSPALRDRLRVG